MDISYSPGGVDIPTKMIFLACGIVIIILALWATSATVQAKENFRELRAANVMLDNLRAEKDELRAKVASLTAYHKGGLKELYPDLLMVTGGQNIVNREYVDSYYIDGKAIQGKLNVNFRNDTDKSINPNVTFRFLTREGLLTASVKIGPWMFDRINAKKTKTENISFPIEYGPPEFLDLIITN